MELIPESPSRQQLFKYWGLLFVRSVIGIIMVALTTGSIYFIHYLHYIYRLPRNSREYYQQRQHIQTQTLLRYSLMIICIFTIDILIITYFEWGLPYFGVGLIAALIYFIYQNLKEKLKNPEKHLKQD